MNRLLLRRQWSVRNFQRVLESWKMLVPNHLAANWQPLFHRLLTPDNFHQIQASAPQERLYR
jgi:hypothetical protein